MSTETRIPEWTIGDRIRKAREHAGLDQDQLADLTGFGRSTLSNWEHDRNAPSVKKLLDLARALDVPVTWLLTGDIPPADTDAFTARYPRDPDHSDDTHGFEQLQLVA